MSMLYSKIKFEIDIINHEILEKRREQNEGNKKWGKVGEGGIRSS